MTDKTPAMDLSLIVSTRNNADSLRALLSSLCICRHPRNWEIIIVDNGSTDETKNIIMSFKQSLPVSYLFYPPPGKSGALNFGLCETRGEVVLFTDDDVIPDERWLINHLETMNRRVDIDAVGGKITVNDSLIPDWLSRSYNLKGILVSAHDLGKTTTYDKSDKYPFGPNMSVRNSVIKKNRDPWPDNIGPGKQIPVGDEMVFFKKLFGNDKTRILYDPECLVEHRVRAGRHLFFSSIIRCFKGGYVAALYLGDNAARETGVSSKMYSVLKRINSPQELACAISRFTGFTLGRLKIRMGITTAPFNPGMIKSDSN